MKTILTNCTVIDCTGNPPMKDMTVVIEGEEIAELKVGTHRQVARKGERVLDLGGAYVLPGLWNVHTHLGAIFPDRKRLMSRESAIDFAIRAGRDAMDALRVGVTGMRVVGQRHYIDVAWKRAFDAGVFVGPRLFVCGKSICATGGHGGRVAVDGPYEMRKAVREQLKHGADQIKICVSAGHAAMSAGIESMRETQLLLDEVKAATEVAHQKGKRVCAHAGGVGIKLVIRGGVDCIEHGYYLDDEAIEMMAENDVFYVPTFASNVDEEFMRESGMAELESIYRGHANRALEGRVLIAKAEGMTREYAQIHRQGFRKALRAGVKIAPGGESNPIGEFSLMEIEHLVRAGMTEMQALIAATRTSADLCGVVDQLGTVEAGKLADLIVVSADPLENISNIRKLKLVMKGGKLVQTEEMEGLASFWELFLFD
jgi:imidazolonepropionase-like amidohydrolase